MISLSNKRLMSELKIWQFSWRDTNTGYLRQIKNKILLTGNNDMNDGKFISY